VDAGSRKSTLYCSFIQAYTMEDDPLSARDNQEQDIVNSDIEGVLFRKEEVEIFDPKILPNNYPAEPST